MAICFLCDTPFQVLNSVILFLALKEEGEEEQADIYINTGYGSSNGLIKRLDEQHLFRHVIGYCYDERNRFGKENSLVNKAFAVLAPSSYLKRWTKQDFLKLYKKTYSMVYVSYPTRYALVFMIVHANAKIAFFEDGIGTYMNNISDGQSLSFRLPYLLRFTKNPWKTANTLYVYNPDFCENDLTENKKRLPSLLDFSSEIQEMVRYIFSYRKQRIYDKYPLIFLSQPNDKNDPEFSHITSTIYKTLKQCDTGRLMIRFHPRDMVREECTFPEDDGKKVWELSCMDGINDNNVLISILSTTQFTPKLIANKEPWLVFLYPLYKTVLSNDMQDSMDRTISRFQELYSCKNKIIIINTLDELSSKMNLFAKLQYHYQEDDESS